jgi:methylthioribose-1-phosphate isomerase
VLPTIEWKDDAVVMIDQRKLPSVEVYVSCRTANDVAKAIKTMVIRGAPAIGRGRGDGDRPRHAAQQGHGHQAVHDGIPEAVRPDGGDAPDRGQLFWAIERMKRTFAAAAQGGPRLTS